MTWFAAILIGLGGSQILSRIAPAQPKRKVHPAPQRTAEVDHPIFDGLVYFFLGYWLVPHDHQ